MARAVLDSCCDRGKTRAERDRLVLLERADQPDLGDHHCVAVRDLSKKPCEACGQQIPVGATVCPFCQKTATETARASAEFDPDRYTKKCPACAEVIKLEALVCRFCGLKLEPATVKAAIEQARLQFEETALTPDKKDKLARGLCPKCDAYNAFLTDARRNLRKCEVCGEQYPLHI